MMPTQNSSLRELKAALDQLLCAVIIVSVVVAILLVEQCSITLCQFTSRLKDASEQAVHGSDSQTIRSKKEKKHRWKSELRRSKARTSSAVKGRTDRNKVTVEEMTGDTSASQEELPNIMPKRGHARINRKILIRIPEEDDERSQKIIKIKNSQWPSLVKISKGWSGCAEQDPDGDKVRSAHGSSSASNTSSTDISADAVDPTQDAGFLETPEIKTQVKTVTKIAIEMLFAENSPRQSLEHLDDEISAATPKEVNETPTCTIQNSGERNEGTAAS